MFRDVSQASFKVGDERLNDPTLYLYQGNPSLIKHVHVWILVTCELWVETSR